MLNKSINKMNDIHGNPMLTNVLVIIDKYLLILNNSCRK